MKKSTLKIQLPMSITILFLISVVLATMKICDVISWSWWLVLLPVILPLSLALLILVPTIIALLVKYVELEAMHEINAKAREKSNAETIDDLAAEYGLERRPGESNLELKHRIAFIKQQNRRSRHGMEE